MFSRSRFNPTTGVMDFWSEFRKPTPYRWLILLVSTLPVVLILWWATGESVLAPPERPKVTYITTYAADQTDEEVIATNETIQAEQDALRARIEALETRKKEIYRELGRATGMDVEEIEQDIAEKRAAEETASDTASNTPSTAEAAPSADAISGGEQ